MFNIRLIFRAVCTFVLSAVKCCCSLTDVLPNLKFKKMNNLRNSVRLVGFLGNDPEVKTVGNNKKLLRVSIATDDS